LPVSLPPVIANMLAASRAAAAATGSGGAVGGFRGPMDEMNSIPLNAAVLKQQ
jgi:hypothetical protein